MTLPTLVGNVGNGRGYAGVGAGEIWKISVLSTQFCYAPETTLRNKVYSIFLKVVKK